MLRPNASWLLDGEWHFAPDPDDQGLIEGWYLRYACTLKAKWPGTVESHMAEALHQLADVPPPGQVVAWYEREFRLPEPNEINLTPCIN